MLETDVVMVLQCTGLLGFFVPRYQSLSRAVSRLVALPEILQSGYYCCLKTGCRFGSIADIPRAEPLLDSASDTSSLISPRRDDRAVATLEPTGFCCSL